jgi:hypothetical protein
VLFISNVDTILIFDFAEENYINRDFCLQLGGLLPITTQPPPTTTPQSVKPPFEASNLINTKPIPVEGPSVSKILALNPV